MNIEQITKRAIGSTQLTLKKHGPAMLTAAGIAGFMATTYLTGKAVLKSQDKVKALKVKSDHLVSKPETDDYTRHDHAVEVGQLWLREGSIILRDFAPAIAVGSVSIFCLVASHGMLKNQQKALAAAYVALDAGYRAYRQRVREEIGEEKELELYRKVKLRDRELGADETLPCEIDYEDTLPSVYSRVFDETNPNYTKTPEYNKFFLKTQERYLNDRLHAYGFVFLNEVLQELGFPREQKGQIVGWKLGNGGDDYISFGIEDIGDPNSRAFINGLAGEIMLDFNVDGPILIDN